MATRRSVAPAAQRSPAARKPAVAKPRKFAAQEPRLFGISRGLWILTGFLFAWITLMVIFHTPQRPNAFDQPGAQIPNKLRSSWGVDNPL